MKYLSVILFLISIATVCCSTVITTQSQTVRVLPGQVILLSCHFNSTITDYDQLTWRFVDHAIDIFQGKRLLIDQPNKYSYKIPQDGTSQLNLQINNAQATDGGHYTCSYKDSSVTHLVKVNTELIPAKPIPFGNYSECCNKANVSAACLPVCVPHLVNNSFDPLINCPDDLDKLLKCFADGRNHVGCCRRSRVPETCLDFCLDTPPVLTTDHLVCLSKSEYIISCFEQGHVYLPTPPHNVNALALSESSILVNWKQPVENSDIVTGYRVLYKDSSSTNDTCSYQSTGILSALTLQYTITDIKSKRIELYVIALSDKGSSLPSNKINIATKDVTPLSGQDINIRDCCVRKGVSSRCQTLLCQASTWKRFDPDALLSCYGYLGSVFTCLTGERNHTNCCQRNQVMSPCLELCSGSPVQTDSSLAKCIVNLPIIEGCVQKGLGTLPSPPTFVKVKGVTWNSATLEWDEPKSTNGVLPSGYKVEYYSSEYQGFIIKDRVSSTVIYIDGLKPDTNYQFRVISESAAGNSLPSETVTILTYPKPDDVIPTQATAIVHNVTECCISGGVKSICLPGCSYSANLVDYFTNDFNVALQCSQDFAKIINCGSDGRDHSSCCTKSNVAASCAELCKITGHSNTMDAGTALLSCVNYVTSIQTCYKEGLETLPKHPKDLKVTNSTKNTITVEWAAPNKGPTVTEYMVEYYENDFPKEISNNEVNDTKYILQNLKPNTQYTIYVFSVANDTLSPSSVTVQEFTSSESPLPPPQINGSDVTANTVWLSRTDCCKNIGMSDECLGLCLNNNLNVSSCFSFADKILSCASDGRNHQPCCERKGLPKSCLPICSGQTVQSGFHGASCFTYGPDIFSCFLDELNLVPQPPPNFIVTFDQFHSVATLKWSPPPNCSTNCQYDVHYWSSPLSTDPRLSPSDGNRNVTTIRRVSSPYNITFEGHGIKYMITVSARNTYGGGQPSPVQTVVVVNPGLADVSIGQEPAGVVNQKTTVLLVCNFFSLNAVKSIKWFHNDNQQPSNQKELKILKVKEEDSGLYHCTIEHLHGRTTVIAHFLNVKFKPEINKIEPNSVEAGKGLSGSVTCSFVGFPDDQTIQWKKEDNLLNTTVSRLSAVVRKDLTKGVLTAVLKISNVRKKDYANYTCVGSNQYGSVSASAEFKDPNMIPPITPAKPPRDIKICCQEAKVPADCMDLCDLDLDFSVISTDLSNLNCLVHLTALMKCGADGRDHSQCCIQKGIHPFCVPLCSGVIPNNTKSNNILECIPESKTLQTCAKEGRDKIPTPPSTLKAVYSNGQIIVSWTEPKEVQDKVDTYKISYTTSSNTKPIDHNVDKNIRHYVIKKTIPDETYTVMVIAKNSYGASQPSQITVKAAEIMFSAPGNLNAKMISETTVELQWSAPSESSSVKFKYTIYYKIYQSEDESTPISTGSLKVQIPRLDKDTTYEAFVVASAGNEASQHSERVIFTTGGNTTLGKSPTPAKRTSDAAIAVGILIPVIIIIVIAIVIFLVLRRKRKSQSESVSFENPNYGRGKVQINGLVEQDGFDYARLQESNSHEYNTLQPSGNMYDNFGTNGAAATLPVHTEEINPSVTHKESNQI